MFPVLVAGLLPEVHDLLVADLTANLALRDSLPSSPGFDGQRNQLLRGLQLGTQPGCNRA